MTEPTLLPLLRGRKISLDDALKSDLNVLVQLKWRDELVEFCRFLHKNLSEIAEVVSRHLGISKSDLEIAEFKEWRHGTFNTCVPVQIKGHPSLPRRVMIRFPQPFKVGETFNPGNVDEKLRCEAATYIWLRKNCPTIPIPRLLAMGFPGMQSFTTLENVSFWNRLIWYCQRLWLGQELSPYVSHRRRNLPGVGYLIIEYVEKGSMLSETWPEQSDDPKRRENLFRGLSQTLLSLAKIPLPKIGSWTINDSGIIALTNRPLSLLLHEFESHEIPTNIPRDLTYYSIEPWVLDMLACQDSRMRQQPNAIHSDSDGCTQLGALTALRGLLMNLVDRRARGGPFVLSLTDLHASNIFVDSDWNITCIIDLEFACVLPIQMVTVPHWLNNRGIDQITDSHFEEYKILYDEFVAAMEYEEDRQQLVSAQGDTLHSQRLRKSWETGSFWYSHALTSVNAFPALFDVHIAPRFGGVLSFAADQLLSKFWSDDAMGFITEKIEDQERYNARIREIFAKASQKSGTASTVEGDVPEKDEPNHDHAPSVAE
ncbi:Hypothetical protein R9X50_00714900 [Acrodontium crateriforme]|uniref:Aminoglycoside phosphotransferase domain-containing protein n=1 Tax=Acrodontium crateriforme TaxID=150365 RepID=A0AAQ3RCK8_9PEZI|nr:Hypothetical protein R9X50_00714900 [Acrodontium crateriforme]